MAPSLLGGFTKSLAMTVLSEIGDKTFFAAAILAMRHPRKLVLAGCLTALIVMTALSASLGWVAPNLISRKWTHHLTTLLFFLFGIWSLWEGFKEDGYRSVVAFQLTFCFMCFGVFVIDLSHLAKHCNSHFRDSEELAEVEAELDAAFKSNKGESKNKFKANDDMKKQQRPFLMQFFSPIFLKAFSITFFGEWGDKSQIATIGLAADENPFGVVLGGIIAQALCTTAAVLGGKSLASQISEKMVELSSGVLFLLFGIMSLLSGPEGEFT
uniref:GDT1 family protein n=1 Tax=Zea mays TaxID=4577 RepID=A0A804LWH0_MAIZE